MGTKMKGLLRGLRYISNIFESDDKEPEMQIGFPTDVKHVAHIGWDGPSVNSPCWMNEFKSASSEPLPITARGERNQAANAPRSPSQDNNVVPSPRDLPTVPLPRPSRRNPSSSSAANPGSPNNREGRRSRRHQSSSGATNSPDNDKSDGSRRSSRRERRSDIISSPSSTTTQDEEAAAAAEKKARRRKEKVSSPSSSGSSTSCKTSRSKGVELPPLKPMREDVEEE